MRADQNRVLAAMRRWDTLYSGVLAAQQWDLGMASSELVGVLSLIGRVKREVFVDIGCGSAAEVRLAEAFGYRALGIDISRYALEAARNHMSERPRGTVLLCQADALTLPVASDVASFVNDRGLLHHISEIDRVTYAKECARILKPHGILFMRGMTRPGNGFVPVTAYTIKSLCYGTGLRVVSTLEHPLIDGNGVTDSNITLLEKMPAVPS